MPTVYKKKNVESLKRKPRDNLPLEVIHAAYNEVFQCQESGISIGAIAKKYNMPKTTLSRYIKNKKNSVSNSFSSVFVSRQIFTQKKESALCDYLLKAGNMHYGLTMKQTRELAYQYAVANRKTISDPWKNNCCASKDWLVGFLNRNKKLCVSEAYSPAFSKSNIESAFAKTGIFPFKRDIFEESDFLCSAVTDRGVPNDNSILVDEFLETATEKPDEPGPTSNIQPFVSPEYVRPYPKALPRKRKQVGRKPGRTRILTDTPKKTEIAEAWKNQIDKQKKVQIKRNLTDSNIPTSNSNIPTSSKKKKIEESESDSEISMSDICEESDDSPFTEEEKEEDSNDRDFEKNDYVLVRFVTETNATVCYIGLVIEKSSQIYKVKFFRRHGISNKFTFPIIDDIQDISGDDTISWNKTCW
ncbi:hypothetical protein QE152_g13677 [Popillia japonica]|uniref:HTH CENPB-type domain-containing protein n=1 Tax=Popillia japonica TaxID=7064 RepID=A0AAW1LBS1_POPJA